MGDRAHDLLATPTPPPRASLRPPRRHPRSLPHNRLRTHLPPTTPKLILLGALNLGAKILRSDSLTITPREPIAIEDMQLIITEQSSSQRLAHRLVVETAQLKRIEVEIPHGLAPRSTFSYEASFRLRCQSLDGDQFFEMPTWALTRDVSFMVFIPEPSKVKDAKLLRDHQDGADYERIEPESQGNGNVLAGDIRVPNIYEVPCISFYVEP